MPSNPNYLLPGEDLNAFNRRRLKFRDAAPPEEEDDNAIHIHLHGAHPAEQDLVAPGTPSGSPVRVKDQPSISPRGTKSAFRQTDQDDPDTGRFEGAVEPGSDYEEEDEPDEDDEQVLATLPPPDDEEMAYQLREMPDGSCAVVLCEEDGGDVLNSVNQGDNRRSMGDSKTRRILHAMNQRHRAIHRTTDAVSAPRKEQTVFMHTPAEGERLEVRRNEQFPDRWLVVLVSDTTDITGTIPKGAQEFDDGDQEPDDQQHVVGKLSAPGTGEPKMPRAQRTGDRGPNQLRRMNVLNKQFWANGGR